MNETLNTIPPAARNDRATMAAVALACVLALIAGWYFLARPHITQALAERRVKEIVDNFNAGAKNQGSNLTIAYQSVLVEREKGRDVVIIANPNVTAPDGSAFSTPRLHILPKNSDFGAMTLELRDMLRARFSDGSTAEWEHAKPLAVDLSTAGQGQPVISYKAWIPSAFEMKQYSGEASPETLVMTTAVTVEDGAMIQGKLDPAGNMRQIEASLRRFKAVDKAANVTRLAAESLDVKLEQAMKDDRHMASSYNLSLRGLNAGDDRDAYGPVSILFDAKMRTELSAASADSNPSASGETIATLNTIEVSAKNFSLSGKGEIRKLATETMPVGSGDFVIKGLPAVIQDLASHGGLTDGQKALVEEMVQKIAGKPLAESDSLAFAITRDAGAGLMIGQATFDDLLALYLTHSIGESGLPDISTSPDGSIPRAPLNPEEILTPNTK